MLEIQTANTNITGWALVGGWPLYTDNALDGIHEHAKVVSLDPLPLPLELLLLPLSRLLALPLGLRLVSLGLRQLVRRIEDQDLAEGLGALSQRPSPRRVHAPRDLPEASLPLDRREDGHRREEERAGHHRADGGAAPLDLVILSQTDPGDPAPQQAIRIRAHALGPDLPRRTLLLSGQHRVHLPALDALAPAKALTTLPRIGPTQLPPGQPFVHLVLRRHSLILADGLPCETFWPGDQALSTLPAPLRCKITRLMGLAPRPARPFLRVQEARKRLTAPTLPAT